MVASSWCLFEASELGNIGFAGIRAVYCVGSDQLWFYRDMRSRCGNPPMWLTWLQGIHGLLTSTVRLGRTEFGLVKAVS